MTVDETEVIHRGLQCILHVLSRERSQGAHVAPCNNKRDCRSKKRTCSVRTSICCTDTLDQNNHNMALDATDCCKNVLGGVCDGNNTLDIINQAGTTRQASQPVGDDRQGKRQREASFWIVIEVVVVYWNVLYHVLQLLGVVELKHTWELVNDSPKGKYTWLSTIWSIPTRFRSDVKSKWSDDEYREGFGCPSSMVSDEATPRMSKE